MSVPVFPSAVNFDAPITERDLWKTIASTEPNTEQRRAKWQRRIHEFEIPLDAMPRVEEADVLKAFLGARFGPWEPFCFITKAKRSRDGLFIGYGDGDRRVWVLPAMEYDFLTVYDAGTEKFEGPDYEVLSAAGPGGSSLIVFRTAPASGNLQTCDAANGKGVFYMRFNERTYEDVLDKLRYSGKLPLREVKETMDPY